MDEVYKVIPKNAFYAILAIVGLAIIYSISPKIGIALFLLVALVALGNMYTMGVIKPAKEVAQ